MRNTKTAVDHVNDFFKGIYDTTVNAPIAFGDFVARISGYRDHQFNSGSVLELNSDLEQKQALMEIKILYEALTHKESLSIIKDFLVKDIENRPAYYLGGFGTTSAIGSTLANQVSKYTYKLSITGAKITDNVNDLFEENLKIIEELSKDIENNQSSNHSIPKEAILLADSGQNKIRCKL